MKTTTLLGIGAALAGYSIVKGGFNSLFGSEEPNIPPPNEVPVNEAEIPAYPTATGSVTWTPNDLAKQVHDKIGGVNVIVYPELAKEIDNLNDEQLKALHNFWNAVYFKSYLKNLREMFQGEWNIWTSEYDDLIARLYALGL